MSERVTAEQIEKLIEFLENNSDLALGHCRSKEGRQRSKRLWGEIAVSLNSLGSGAMKDGPGWSKYWSEYKNRLKAKIRNINVAIRQTGGGSVAIHFSPLEQRARQILRENVGCPMSGVQATQISLLQQTEAVSATQPV